MKKTRVYLIRNAKPDYTVMEECQRPLTESGKCDAEAILKKISRIKVDAVYSSPSRRVIETLQPIASKYDKDIITDEGLCERKIGDWLEDYGTYARRQWANYDFRLPEGESLRMVQTRSVKFLDGVIHKHAGTNVVVGTHGMALSAVINHFDPRFGENEFWSMVDKMPFIVKMEFEGDRFKKYEIIEL